MEDPTQQNTPPLLPQAPRSLLEELSHFVQQLPAWAFALISLIGIFMLYQGFGGVVTFLLFGTNVNESNVNAVRWATMFGQVFFLLVPTLVLAKLRFPITKNVFRFGEFNVSQIFLVIVAVFALQQLLQGYMMLQELLPVHFPPFMQRFIDQIKEMMEQMYAVLTSAHSLPEFLLVVLVIALTPAFCEELLFRGLIQRTLEDEERTINATPEEKDRKALAAAVIAGVVFGLYHINPFAAIPLIALGVYFGFVVYRTRNIVTAIVAHFINNFVACLALYLNLGEDFIAISPTETPDTAMLAANFILSAVVFLFTTYYLVRVTSRSTTS